MNDKSASFDDHPALEDRQAAERKLCRLFKSFGIDAMSQRDRLIDPYLDSAAALWRPHASVDFAALAAREAEADLEVWFTALLGETLEDRASAVMTGRAAFLMSGGPEHFSDLLLLPIEELPVAFARAMNDQAPSAVPPSEFGEMHHQPYDAWSPASMMPRGLSSEGGLFQSLAGLVRRDERAAGFSWRSFGRTSS